MYSCCIHYPSSGHCPIIVFLFLGSGSQWKRHDEGNSVPAKEEAPSALCCELKAYCKYLNVKAYVGSVLPRVLVVCLLKILGPAPSGKRVETAVIEKKNIRRQSVTHPGCANYRKQKGVWNQRKTISFKGNIKMTDMVVPACNPRARRILGQGHLGLHRERETFTQWYS